MIKRNLSEQIKEHLKRKEITLLAGPRQSGKTTILLMLKEWLEKSGEAVCFYNLDIEADKQFFESQEKLLRQIRLEIGGKSGFVFIDEIQRKENAGLFLKGIYDMQLPYKLIVSGSGSLELKESIHESLAGRKQMFELTTLTFEEFVNFKTDYRYENTLGDFFESDQLRGKELREEYLNFGGYPRVVLEETLVEKRKVIDEIYRSYLEKDIVYLLRIDKTEAFTQLFRVLAAQTGKLVNSSELSRTIGISVPTVKKFLWYLEKTYMAKKVSPYFRNIRKEITKSPLFYLGDLGLQNYAAGEFGNALLNSRESGFHFQNFIFQILTQKIKFTSGQIHFWRSKDGAEVDFVIENGSDVVPIEVKYTASKSVLLGKSFLSFLEKYHPKKAYLINLAHRETIQQQNSAIHIIPFYDLFQEKFDL